MGRGRPSSQDTYKNLLEYYNKGKGVTTCECGKIIPSTQYEKHLTTKIHQMLLRYKISCSTTNDS